MVPQTKYIKQSLKKHIRDFFNYLWVTPEEAEKELQGKKRLFIASWKTHGGSTHAQYFNVLSNKMPKKALVSHNSMAYGRFTGRKILFVQ